MTALFGSSYTVPKNLYVKTTGSDSTGNGSATKPWRTAAKAQSYLRGRWNRRQTKDITVNLGTGVTDVPATFIQKDSGRNGRNVVYKSSDGVGLAGYSGGTTVSGWSAFSGSISVANVSGSFFTMWENGKRGRNARKPNYVADASHPTAMAPYFRATGQLSHYTNFDYDPLDIDPSGLSLTDLHITEWTGGVWNWFTDTTPVSSIDTVGHKFVLAHETRHWIFQQSTGSRYFVHGDLSLLDQAGEWHHDRTGNKLYYWPTDGAIGSQTITISTSPQVVKFAGASTTGRVHHIVLDGLDIQYSGDFPDWYRYANWGSGPDNTGHSTDVPHTYQLYDHQRSLTQARSGAVYLENADHITIKNCHIHNTGLNGIYGITYAKNITVQNTWVEHTGYYGIFLEGNYPAEGDTVRDWTISNCRINNTGEMIGDGGGIIFANAGHSTVDHCEIYLSPRNAVFVTTWTDIAQADSYSHDSTFSYLKIHDVMQDSGDNGAITTAFVNSLTGGPYLNNTWNQITIDAVSAHASMTDGAPNGVYTDFQTYGQVFSNVWVISASGGPRHDLSGEHFETNCSWNGGFNSGLIDVANIGTTGSFPYP